eukprot:7384757-Pyramimonas_sp.AAC.1
MGDSDRLGSSIPSFVCGADDHGRLRVHGKVQTSEATSAGARANLVNEESGSRPLLLSMRESLEA